MIVFCQIFKQDLRRSVFGLFQIVDEKSFKVAGNDPAGLFRVGELIVIAFGLAEGSELCAV